LQKPPEAISGGFLFPLRSSLEARAAGESGDVPVMIVAAF
jgi:hypothetical protein